MKLLAYVPGTKAWKHRREAELCRQAIVHIHEIVDRELPSSQLVQLEQHLDACRGCGVEAEVIRGLKEAIGRVGSEADPASVAKLEAFARRLCDEQPE